MGIFFNKVLLELKKVNPETGEEEEIKDEDETPADNNEEDNTETEEPETEDNTEDSESQPGDDSTEISDDEDDASQPGDDPTNVGDDEGDSLESPDETDDTNSDSQPGDDPTNVGEEDDTNSGSQPGEDPTDFEDDANETDTSEPGDDPTNIDGEEGQSDNNENLQDMETQVFKDLTPEQLVIKNKELKDRYLEVFNIINDVINRTSTIPKTMDNTNTLKFIMDTLIKLKDTIVDYMTDTYDSKTYIENNINYQQYLAILTSVNNLFIEITPKNDEK